MLLWVSSELVKPLPVLKILGRLWQVGISFSQQSYLPKESHAKEAEKNRMSSSFVYLSQELKKNQLYETVTFPLTDGPVH